MANKATSAKAIVATSKAATKVAQATSKPYAGVYSSIQSTIQGSKQGQAIPNVLNYVCSNKSILQLVGLVPVVASKHGKATLPKGQFAYALGLAFAALPKTTSLGFNFSTIKLFAGVYTICNNTSTSATKYNSIKARASSYPATCPQLKNTWVVNQASKPHVNSMLMQQATIFISKLQASGLLNLVGNI